MKTLPIALIALLMLSACKTVKGAARDIDTAGQTITSEARKAQAAM